MNWSDLYERHFDKLLLGGVFLILVAVAAGLSADWAQRMADTTLGALIGIITGRAITRSSDKNSKEKPPQ